MLVHFFYVGISPRMLFYVFILIIEFKHRFPHFFPVLFILFLCYPCMLGALLLLQSLLTWPLTLLLIRHIAPQMSYMTSLDPGLSPMHHRNLFVRATYPFRSREECKICFLDQCFSVISEIFMNKLLSQIFFCHLPEINIPSRDLTLERWIRKWMVVHWASWPRPIFKIIFMICISTTFLTSPDHRHWHLFTKRAGRASMGWCCDREN